MVPSNAASADRISTGNNNTRTPKRGVTIPDSNAPVRNPAQMPAIKNVRYRCVSQAPWLSGRGARLTASARCTPILLNVPVTKVRLTFCAPTRDRAVFMAPIAKLSTENLSPARRKRELREANDRGQQDCDYPENHPPYSLTHPRMREQSSCEGPASENHSAHVRSPHSVSNAADARAQKSGGNAS